MLPEPFWLRWAQLAVALFDAITLLWLGLTVLLAAERRTWGIWLAGGGLLLGALFFVSHLAILGSGPDSVSRDLDNWWRAAWLVVIVLPGAWYVLMLWYGGFWEPAAQAAGLASLRRRQAPWLVVAGLLALALVGLALFGRAVPSFDRSTHLALPVTPSRGLLLLLVCYPFYVLLCILLALDSLRSPGPTERWLGDLARRRARPWFVATTALLLVVGLLAAGGLGWLGIWEIRPGSAAVYNMLERGVAWFDLVSAILIGTATICLGQAIVAYEIFTGKTLPRHGLRRYWRNALILAAGYGAVAGWGLASRLSPVYLLLISALLMTAFYALLGWRSFAERERTMAGLRPFVVSQRLAEQLLDQTKPLAPASDVPGPFCALCEDVLGARAAYLVARGPLAALAGPPLKYPGGERSDLPWLDADALARWVTPGMLCLEVEPAQWGGTSWAVPLWSERGLIGILLLAGKRDGGLYAQEEIEIARAACEHLIDMAAGTVLARRLMDLQRQRLVESQVMDRRARRVLHDDVLPRLHTAMLALSRSPGEPGVDEALGLLGEVHGELSGMLRRVPAPTAPAAAQAGLLHALRRALDDELAEAFDDVSWQLGDGVAARCAGLAPYEAEVLYGAAREAIRNAAKHARPVEPPQPLCLCIRMQGHSALVIEIEDNGGNLAGVSQGQGGAGQGLALHSTLMAVIGGTLELAGQPGCYTCVTLTLPESQFA
jgi:signal transduction histidine kinase